MTKTVRIENACNSNYKVVVEVWERGFGEEKDMLIHTANLDYPTQLTEQYITSTRYLVVKENGERQ